MSAYDALERQLFAAVESNAPDAAAEVPVDTEASQSLGRPTDVPARSAGPRRLRPRRRLVPALVGVATAGVLGLVGFASFAGDDGSGGLLSPEAAIAAVRSDLKTGVLRWEATTDDGPIEQWIDLTTGASRVARPVPERFRRELSGQRAQAVEWRDRNDNRWQQQTRDQKSGEPIVVREHPSYFPPRTEKIPTPVDEIEEALTAAATGRATVEPVASVDGIPVVRVNQNDRRILSITREPEPRLVEYIRASWSCDPGVDCSKPSNDYTRDALTTTRWEILPATETTLAEVNPPPPTDSRYKLVGDPSFNKMMKRMAKRTQELPATPRHQPSR